MCRMTTHNRRRVEIIHLMSAGSAAPPVAWTPKLGIFATGGGIPPSLFQSYTCVDVLRLRSISEVIKAPVDQFHVAAADDGMRTPSLGDRLYVKDHWVVSCSVPCPWQHVIHHVSRCWGGRRLSATLMAKPQHCRVQVTYCTFTS